MKLVVLETPLGLDIPSFLIDEDRTIADHPLRRRVVLPRDPFVEILSVKQDDRVRRSCPADRAGSDDLGHRLPDFGVLRLCFLRGRCLLPEERTTENETREREKEQKPDPHIFTVKPEMSVRVVGIL
jgi:hypothetical protein